MNKMISWFLGYLASDGSITRPKYRHKGDESHISFCINYHDADALYKVKKILGTKASVRTYKDYDSPSAVLCIYDRRDIMEKYSNIKDVVPENISPRHYIRGLIDGDGCLNYRINRNSFRINLTNASYNIVNYISMAISNYLGVNYKCPKFKSHDNLYIVEWEGKIAKLIAWWLYCGDISECVLDRKLKYYIDFVLCGRYGLGRADEILIAIGDRGEYLLNRKNNGILVSVGTDRENTLKWSKILSRIIKRSDPVPVNRGIGKYYSLYIPVIDTQDIEIDEDIVQ